jgi:hypothetical protein
MRCSKLGVCLALIVTACLPLLAQDQMQVNVPFPFTTAGKNFPAGEYRVAVVSSGDRDTWMIQGDHQSALLFTNSVISRDIAHDPSLIFRQVGGQYALTRIWVDGYVGRSVLVQEPKIAKQGSEVQVAAE